MGLFFTEIQIYFPNVTAASTIWRTHDKKPAEFGKIYEVEPLHLEIRRIKSEIEDKNVMR